LVCLADQFLVVFGWIVFCMCYEMSCHGKGVVVTAEERRFRVSLLRALLVQKPARKTGLSAYVGVVFLFVVVLRSCMNTW
jgi:hypothetical protein